VRSAAPWCIAALFFLTLDRAAAASLSVQDAVRFALAHNTAIAQKESAAATALAAYTRKKAQELPQITGTLANTLGRSSNATGNLAQFGISPLSRFSQNTAQIGTQWTVYNGSLNQILAQEDKRQLEAAREDLRQAQSQITGSVVASYFAVAAKRRGLSLAQSNLEYQRALLSVAQLKERAGVAAGVDVLRADVAVQQGSAAMLSAASDVETARETLAQLIGAPLDTAFGAAEALPQPPVPAQPLAALISLAQQHRPDVAASIAAVSVARLARAAQDTDLRPQIALNAAFGNQSSPTSFVDHQNQVDAQNSFCRLNPSVPNCAGAPFPNIARGNPGFWQLGATSTFSIPLIDYGTRRTAHAAGDEAIRSAELSLASTRGAAEAEVRQAFRAAQTGLAALAYQEEAAKLAAQSARIAQLQYRNGLLSLTDANATQQTALSAQSDLFNARVAYINAIVRLRIALGTFDPLGVVADL